MNRSFKIFLSCACGAFIGSLSALEVSHQFWWLGLLTGMFVGYLSYDFKQVMKSIPIAFKATRKSMGSFIETLTLQKIKNDLKTALCINAIIFLVFASGYLDMLALNPIIKDPTVSFVFGIALSLVSVAIYFATIPVEKLKDIENNHVKIFLIMFLFLSPLGLCYLIFQIVALMVKVISVAVSFLRGFSRNFFILIHSDMRLLCSIDAAIGACIGYFAGSAIIGALTGGAFGVFNYEVISKLVLKIQPKAN